MLYHITWAILWFLPLLFWGREIYKHRKTGYTQDSFKNAFKWLKDAPVEPKCMIHNVLAVFAFGVSLFAFISHVRAIIVM